MALEPTEPQGSETDAPQDFFQVLEEQILGKGSTESQDLKTTEVAPDSTQDTQPEPENKIVDPLKEILSDEEEPTKNKLPIDEETEEVEEIPKDKAGYRIKELKEEIKTKWKPEIAAKEQELAQVKARLTELEVEAARAKELEEKTKQYEQELSVLELTKTEAWHKEIKEPTRAISDNLVEIADRYGIDYDKLAEAVENRDNKVARAMIKDLVSGMDVSPDDLYEINDLRGKMQPILQRMDDLYANADKALLELKARSEQETAEQIAARAEERRKATSLVAERVAAKIPLLAEEIKTLSSQVGDTDFDALDPQNKAYNALAGNLLPKMLKQLSQLKSEYDTALDELEKFRRAKPNPGGFVQNGSSAPRKDFMQAVMQDMGFAPS